MPTMITPMRDPAMKETELSENSRTIVAAAIIFAGFLLFAYFLPSLMKAAVALSPYAAGVVAVVFIFAFFAVFWLRSRSKP